DVVAAWQFKSRPFGDLSRKDALLPGGLAKHIVERVTDAAVQHRLMIWVIGEREKSARRRVSHVPDEAAESFPDRGDALVGRRGLRDKVRGKGAEIVGGEASGRR